MKPDYRSYWPRVRLPHSNQVRKTFADRKIATLLSLDFIFVNTKKKKTEVGSPLNVPFHNLHNTHHKFPPYISSRFPTHIS